MYVYIYIYIYTYIYIYIERERGREGGRERCDSEIGAASLHSGAAWTADLFDVTGLQSTVGVAIIVNK